MNQYFLAHVTIAELWLGLLFSLIGILIGALANHFLANHREANKEERAKNDAITAKQEELRAAMTLTESESWILRKCIIPDGFERGRVWLMRVDAFGTWVRAGIHDFSDQFDIAFQVRYLDAFESLLNRGFFRQESENLYVLTGMGFQRAEKEAEQAGASDGEKP